MFPNPDWWVSHPLVPRRHGPCEGIDDASLSKTCLYARANACTSSSGRQATGYTAACPCLQTAARGHLIGAPDRCESAPPRPSAKGKEREGGVHRCMQATTRCYTASTNVLFPFLGGIGVVAFPFSSRFFCQPKRRSFGSWSTHGVHGFLFSLGLRLGDRDLEGMEKQRKGRGEKESCCILHGHQWDDYGKNWHPALLCCVHARRGLEQQDRKNGHLAGVVSRAWCFCLWLRGSSCVSGLW